MVYPNLSAGRFASFNASAEGLFTSRSSRRIRAMTMRITATPQPSGAIIKVDGHLGREDIGELTRVCQEQTGPVHLDLTEVTSVDREAAVAPRQLLRTVAELRAASPYIRLLLETGAEPLRGGKEDEAQY
jgi:hypothetical protein